MATRRTRGGTWRWPGTMSSARSTIRNTDRGHRRKGICMTGDEGDHQRRVTVFLGNICLGCGPDSCLRNGCLNLPEAEIGYRHLSRLAGRVRVPVSMHFTRCPEHSERLSFATNAFPLHPWEAFVASILTHSGRSITPPPVENLGNHLPWLWLDASHSGNGWGHLRNACSHDRWLEYPAVPLAPD